MADDRHVALLRGINVGGKNIIKMADLRAEFERMGFTDVTTLIQSGNVIFSSRHANTTKITAIVEKGLSEAFGYGSRVVILSSKELALVVRQAPPGFGKEPARYRYDVLFVKEPLTAKEALAELALKAGVDTAHAGKHALYFRRLNSKASQSHLSRLVQKPVYKNLTIRNWNTTTKLLRMLSE